MLTLPGFLRLENHSICEAFILVPGTLQMMSMVENNYVKLFRTLKFKYEILKPAALLSNILLFLELVSASSDIQTDRQISDTSTQAAPAFQGH